jgi:heme exporter protein C
MGCATDFRIDPAVSVLRVYRLARFHRRPAPRRPCRRLLAIVGSVNVPIIYFSVKWWNTLHQGSTIKFTGTSMHVAMQQAMFITLVACWLYAIAVILARVRSIILERERHTKWITELPEVK